MYLQVKDKKIKMMLAKTFGADKFLPRDFTFIFIMTCFALVSAFQLTTSDNMWTTTFLTFYIYCIQL